MWTAGDETARRPPLWARAPPSIGSAKPAPARPDPIRGDQPGPGARLGCQPDSGQTAVAGRRLGIVGPRDLLGPERRTRLAEPGLGRSAAGWFTGPSGRNHRGLVARAHRHPATADRGAGAGRAPAGRPAVGHLSAGASRRPGSVRPGRAAPDRHRGHGAGSVRDGYSGRLCLVGDRRRATPAHQPRSTGTSPDQTQQNAAPAPVVRTARRCCHRRAQCVGNGVTSRKSSEHTDSRRRSGSTHAPDATSSSTWPTGITC